MASVLVNRYIGVEDYVSLMQKGLVSSGHTYESLAEDLNVSPRVVQKILNAEFDAFPSVYILNLLDQATRKIGVKNSNLKDFVLRTKKSAPITQNNHKKKKGIFVPKIISLLFVGIFVMAGTVFLSQQVLSFVEAPDVEIISPTETVSDEEYMTISGITDKKAKITVNGQGLPVGPNGEFSQRVKLSPGLNSFIVISKNALGRESRDSIFITYQPEQS